MLERKYFGTDGIRGRVGYSNINPEFMLKLGWAIGRVLANGQRKKVIIGKDTRVSGYMLESALEAGLAAAGVDIRLLGPMPTPAIAYLTRTLRANAGIVISASHNYYEDNGVKFFTCDGGKLPDSVELKIEEELDKPLEVVHSSQLGKASRVTDAAGRYIEFCKATIPSLTRLSGLKIVVDCANGATYHIAPNVFKELGAEVIAIGDEPDGFNINHECGSTKPLKLRDEVIKHNADIGIALDGDGDRVMLVDANGNIIDGDQILYIIAKDRHKRKLLNGGVVGTLMSNFALEQVLKDMQIPFVRTQVGDRYVLEELTKKQWILGGESSGHVVCLDKTTTGDGIVVALQVLAIMIKQEKALHELLTPMVLYPQILINIQTMNAEALLANAEVLKLMETVNRSLKNNGRVLIRPSGTEPLLRIMVEGADEIKVKTYANMLAEDIKKIDNRLQSSGIDECLKEQAS